MKELEKYEVAPGLNRVIKTLMKKWVEEGDEDAFRKIKYFQDKRMELLMPKKFMRETK
jgi:hypothetical protein